MGELAFANCNGDADAVASSTAERINDKEMEWSIVFLPLLKEYYGASDRMNSYGRCLILVVTDGHVESGAMEVLC